MSTRQRDASGRFVKAGGQSLGTATATILMVADKFADGARVVQKSSADAGKSVDLLGGALGRAKKAAQDFDNSNLGKIQKEIKGVRDQLALVSAAAAGISFFGINQAREMARVNTQFSVLLGSQKLASQEMEKLKKFADDFHLPQSEILAAGANLLPLMKATGAEIDKLILSSSKLAQLDPAQGLQGAQTALREFLAGDVTSLYRRFELGITKDQYREVVENAKGDTNAMLDGLDALISKTGLTNDALKEMNEADPFPVLTDGLKTALAEGFTPLLKTLVPIVKDFNAWLRNLRENHPEILKIGAALTVAVAAGAPLLTFISAAIAGFKAMKVAAAAVSLGHLAKGGIAVAGGVALGTAGATALANAGVRTGDLGRIAGGESALDILGERLKQIFVIVIDQLFEFGRVLAKTVVYIQNAITQFVNVFKLGGTLIDELFGNLQLTFAKFVTALGEFIATLPGQAIEGQRIRGSGLQGQLDAGDRIITAQKARDDIVKELVRGFEPKQEDLDAVDANINAMKNTIVGGLIDMLFPMADAVEKVKPVFDNTTRAANDAAKAIGDSEEYLQQQASDIADATKKYNDEISASELKKQQDIIALNEKFAQEQVEIARNRVKEEAKALEDLNNDLRKLNTDLTRDTEKEGRDRARKNIEMEIEFQREELADAEAHRDKLLQIEEDYRKRQQDAAENFDFAALFDLSEQVVQQTNAANEEYDKQRQERVQALQYEREDLVREYGAQREERLIQYEQDRADRQAQYEQERARIVNESAEKMLLAQQAHSNELTQIANKYANEQALRQQAYANELALLMQTEQQRLQIMAQAQEALLQQAYSFMNRARPGANAGSSGSRNGSLDQAAVDAYNKSIQAQRDRHERAERENKKTYGVGGYESGRAWGGPVLGGRTYPVNEIRNESYVRGTQTIPLPDGAGFFTPNRSGEIKPNRSESKPQINVTVQLNAPIDSGILTLDQAIPLIQRAAQEGAEIVLNDWLAQYSR
jgi:hypothetical protein